MEAAPAAIDMDTTSWGSYLSQRRPKACCCCRPQWEYLPSRGSPFRDFLPYYCTRKGVHQSDKVIKVKIAENYMKLTSNSLEVCNMTFHDTTVADTDFDDRCAARSQIPC
eukprot:3003454-Pleurochrysis_carterae.AAC.2